MRRKILIVDDSETVRSLIRATLSEAGYDVYDTEDGNKALELVGKKHFDLLMTDLNLPQIDGFEFISKVRNIPGRRFLPIIVLSDDCVQSRSMECVRAGASGCLQKPIDTEQVLRILKTIIPY